MGEYDDIINMKRPASKRLKMDIIQRANIFNPFAALEGYAAAINESGRVVNKKEELTEDQMADLNNKLNYISDKKNVEATVIYFLKDKYKEGGEYKTIKGVITKFNLNDAFIIIEGEKIKFDDLVEIILEK